MAVGTLQSRLTKVAPFEDDFNDGNYMGWSVFGGTWSASSYYARNTSGGTDRLVKAFTEPDYAMSFSYYREDSSNEILLYFRAAGGSGGTLRLDLTGTYARVVDSASSPTQLAYSSAHGSATGTWYDGYVEVDGANVKVMLGEQGEMLEQVFNVATATTTDTARLEIRSQNGAARFDNIRILGDGLTQTTTFAVNNANEMTSMTNVNGTTTFAYDGWGRMESKSRGSHAADYGFRYGHFLASYDTNFPDEFDSVFVISGRGLRHAKTVGATTSIYRWGQGTRPHSVEDDSGTLETTFTPLDLADISGSDAATGQYQYRLTDKLGSGRSMHSHSKDLIGKTEYSPFGTKVSGGSVQSYHDSFAGNRFESEFGAYHTRFRFYIPQLSRWEKPDFLRYEGHYNVYGYAQMNPTNWVDLDGLRVIHDPQMSNPPNGSMNLILECMSNFLPHDIRIVSGFRPPDPNKPNSESSAHGQEGGAAVDIGCNRPGDKNTPEDLKDAFNDCVDMYLGPDYRRRACQHKGDKHVHLDFWPDPKKPDDCDKWGGNYANIPPTR